MRCPECVEAGQRSKVYVGLSTTTLMYAQPFYDEDGRWHHHDPNQTTTEYTCSNGHSWKETTGPHQCAWGDFP